MRWLAVLLVTTMLLATGGCGRAIRGGPASTLNTPAEADGANMPLAGRELLAATTAAERNAVLQRRLVLIDQGYETYVTALRQDKTVMDLATGLAGLAIGVAGTLTDSVAAKTNYAAAGTLLTGGVAVVDQTLFYEQTVLALVAAMDANRTEVRLAIETRMADNFDNYSGPDAFRDLQAYERAGSLLAAITYVNATSRGIQDAAENELANVRDIFKLTPAQSALKACTTNSLAPTNPKRTASALLKAAGTIGVTVADADKADVDKIAAVLRSWNRNADPTGVVNLNKALADAGALVDCAS